MRIGASRLARTVLTMASLMAVGITLVAKLWTGSPAADGELRFAAASQHAATVNGRHEIKTVAMPHQPEIAPVDMTATGYNDLKVSADGARLRFKVFAGPARQASRTLEFDLHRHRLAHDASPSAQLHVANTTSLPVKQWRDQKYPSLKLHRLRIEAGDRSRALAISPDRKFFALGSDRGLYYFQADAGIILPKPAMRWKRPVDGPVRAINFAQNGKLLIAVYNDGSIRWHRTRDGAVILTLWLTRHRDAATPHWTPQWTLATPDGYYTAAPGAHDLIGWHTNRGIHQPADFIDVEKLRKVFYRPDIVAATLRLRSSEMAIAHVAFGLARLANSKARKSARPTTLISMSSP